MSLVVEDVAVAAARRLEVTDVPRRDPRQERRRLRAADEQLSHVRDVENARSRPHRAMLGKDALELDGHLPAGEIDQSRAERTVAFMERSAEHHGRTPPTGKNRWGATQCL